MAMGGLYVYAVELVDEQSCRWNEGGCPLVRSGSEIQLAM